MVASRQAFRIVATALFVGSAQGVVMQQGNSLMQTSKKLALTGDGLHRDGHVEGAALLEIPGLRKSELTDPKAYEETFTKMNSEFPPKAGAHKYMEKTLAEIPSTCPGKVSKIALPADDPTLCKRTEKLAKLLVNSSAGRQEPLWTFEAEYRSKLGLQFWLYFPGVASFETLNTNLDQGISTSELSAAFGQTMTQSFIDSDLFNFMDSQGYENSTDGLIDRTDLVKFLFAAVMLRDYQISLDGSFHDNPTLKLLKMAQRLHKAPELPHGPAPMSKWPKLACIFGIVVGTVVLHMIVSGAFRWSQVALSSEPEKKEGKEEVAK